MKREQAEYLAIQALGWMASDSDRLGHFLNASGASADDLRGRAQDPEFLEFVLDFVMLDDESVLAFCAENNLLPESVKRARYVLSGDL